MGYEIPSPPPDFETWEDFAKANGIPPEEWDSIGAVVDPDGHGPRLLFLKVPEGKTAKNRVHIDIHTDQSLPQDQRVEAQDELAAELVTAGAAMVERRSDHNSTWVVMTDPEGNEFCVV